jgi:UDP-N-acetylglucosamine:LPS N-acetylglucosamine transferase
MSVMDAAAKPSQPVPNSREREPLRLVAGASAGGHTNELLILLDAAQGVWPVQPAVFVTTMEIAGSGFARFGRPVRVIGEADRRKPLQALAVLWRAMRWVLHDRPDVIVTTGSMPMAVYSIWAKLLLRSRIVWVDSVAQVDDLSLSGKVMRRVADVCLAQWPEVSQRYPNVQYVGEVM